MEDILKIKAFYEDEAVFEAPSGLDTIVPWFHRLVGPSLSLSLCLSPALSLFLSLFQTPTMGMA